MKAIILAAGKGTRMFTITPKPLVTLLERPLIEWVITSAKEAGISKFIIVTGYEEKMLREQLGNGEKYGVKIKWIHNPEWHRENGVSLFKAYEAVGKKSGFFLFMADHIFTPEVLIKFINERNFKKTTIFVDTNISKIYRITQETKLLIENHQIISIGKSLKRFNAVDCGIFYCTKAMYKAVEKTLNEGKEKISDIIKNLIKEKQIKYFNVEDSFWMNINTRDCLEEAERRLLREFRIDKEGSLSSTLNIKS